MNIHFENFAAGRYQLLSLALATSLALPLPSLAASIALATAPLANSTTTTVKPNLLLVLDNSGSMDWDHMPDDVSDGGSDVPFAYGYYGIRSNQCNQVYYNPATTYKAPVDATGTSFANATFTSAWTNGFSTGSGSSNLQTGFTANQSGIGGNAGGTDAGGTAYYYNYSGAQTTQLQKNYNSTTNTFYKECNSAQYASPGKDVFTKIVLSNAAAATTATIVASCSSCSSTSVSSIKLNSTQEIMSGTAAGSTTTSTVASNIAAQINLCKLAKVGNCTTTGGHGYTATASGSTVTIAGLAATTASLIATQSGNMALERSIFPQTDATKLTNFANWYSFYRTRLLMMKTATGQAFSTIGNTYRVGFMKLSASTSPTVTMAPFETSQRTNWYTALYGTVTSGSTPLRTALSNAGRYFAGKLAVTDPLEYSCQQNFAIMSTDGYWNSGDDINLTGTSNSLGNQDGTAGRPMYDGAQAGSTVTTSYSRKNYSTSSSGCTGSKKRLLNQPQLQSCSVTTVGGVAGAETCTAWANNGASVYVSPYTSSTSTCASSVTVPSPNPSTRVVSGSPVTTAGASGGSSDSLADVAMYYYQTDLRTSALSNCGSGVDLCENNVFINGSDNNTQQHMATFTLGLGASGWMNYSSSYLGDNSGDYAAVKLGSVADSSAVPPVCSWQANGTICNWPLPGMSGSNGLIANIDDLWHAAVNGHGAYFSATDSESLAAGLSNALTGIKNRKGSASAAATSTLNPVAGNNYAYFASYTTVIWKGNLEARGINVDTGAIGANAFWCVENVVADLCASPSTIAADTSGSTTIYNCVTPNSVICTGGTMVGTDCLVQVATTCNGTMASKVSDLGDTRIIKTANSTGTALINFDASYATANPTYFDAARISTLGQWSTLTAAQQTAAQGINLVNFLRGQYGHEDRTSNAVADRLYRYREAVLGDALESQPQFVGAPVFDYPYPGYAGFKAALAGRPANVYMGTNDGMMHAFAADTGIERWAYVPSMVIPNMWKLADDNYGSIHTNFVNGTAVTSDVCISGCSDAATAVWKTIMVAGLNGGGRGYYALDITDALTPVLLWEFTPTAGIGKIKDDDLGYGYGRAVITTKADGSWVVLLTSGYNNTSPGTTGQGYLYVLNAYTGAKISKIGTGVGSTTTPSGLGRIAAWNLESGGNKAGYVYGGDLLGNVWRFDINGTTPAVFGTGDVLKLAVLLDPLGATQPITTTPLLGKILNKRVIFIGTGKYLETGDLITTQKQTQYAIKDDDATSTLGNLRGGLLVNQTLINNPDGTATRLVSTSNKVDFNSGFGWYVDFPDKASGTNAAERVNIDADLVEGALIVPTIVPSNTACAPGGFGWLNYFNYLDGTAIGIASIKFDSPIVGVSKVYTDTGAALSVVTAGGGVEPPVTPPKYAPPPGFQKNRVIWRELH